LLNGWPQIAWGLLGDGCSSILSESVDSQNPRRTAMNATMNTGKILVELTVAEAQQVLAIALDDDAREALEFLKDNLAMVVDKSLQYS
jgi:hypothetical protein